MLSTAPIVPAAQPTTSAHNAIRQQLVAAGASEQFIKLVTGEYENLSLPVAIPDFGLRKFNPAPAVNTAAGNTPAGSSGGIGSTNNPNLPQQGINGAAASSAPNNQPAGNTINQPAAGARTTQPVPSEDKKAASTSWLGAFPNRAAMWLGIAGIAGLAVIGTFLGSKSRFRSSSEPSSKPATTNLVTGKNALPPSFTFGSNMATNILAGTNLPPIPSAQSGATNTVTSPSTNTPPTGPTNSVAEATSPTNTVTNASAPENSGNTSSTESAKASDPETEASSWYTVDPLNIFDGALSFLKPTRPPLAIPGAVKSNSASTNAPVSEAKTQALRTDFSAMSLGEMREKISSYKSIAVDAVQSGQTPDEANRLSEKAARDDGNDPSALIMEFEKRRNGPAPAAPASVTGSTNSAATPSAKQQAPELRKDFSSMPLNEVRGLIDKYQGIATTAHAAGKDEKEALKAASDAARLEGNDPVALAREFRKRTDYASMDTQELSTIFAPYFKYGEELTKSGKSVEEAMQLTQARAQSEGHDFHAMVAALKKRQSQAQPAQPTASNTPTMQAPTTAVAVAGASTKTIATRTATTRAPLTAPIPDLKVTPKSERPAVVTQPVASPRAKEAFPEMFAQEKPESTPRFRSADMKAAWALRDKYVAQARASGATEEAVWPTAVAAAAKDGIDLQATADKLAAASLGNGYSVRQAVKNADPVVLPQQGYRWVSERSRSGERVAMVSGDGHVLGETKVTKFFGIPVWKRVVTPPGVTKQQFQQLALMNQANLIKAS